jgi:hypothetical protein
MSPPKETEHGKSAAEDDEIIELSDDLILEEEDDGVIDLVDLAEIEEPPGPATSIDRPEPSREPEEEEVVDLSEMVLERDIADDVEAIRSIEPDDEPTPAFELEPPFAELEQADAEELPDIDALLEESPDATTPEEEKNIDELAASLGINLADAEPVETAADGAVSERETGPQAAPAINLQDVSAEQLDAALERVIEKVYGEKIEGLLFEAIEKKITREIERLKTALLKDDTDSVS